MSTTEDKLEGTPAEAHTAGTSPAATPTGVHCT